MCLSSKPLPPLPQAFAHLRCQFIDLQGSGVQPGDSAISYRAEDRAQGQWQSLGAGNKVPEVFQENRQPQRDQPEDNPNQHFVCSEQQPFDLQIELLPQF